VKEGEVAQPIWTPTPQFASASRIADYQRWLAQRRGLRFDRYDALWCWSVDDPAAFWQSIWDYFDLQADAPVRSVLSDAPMPGARWFEGARLNYVQQVFRHARADRPALRYAGEAVPLSDMSWAELQRQVAGVATSLRAMGVGPGDRVAAYLPNIPQTVVAFLAAASIGAVWSVCAPEMGPVAVLDRFRQIEPKVLFAVAGYRHGGGGHDRSEVLRELLSGLPGVHHWVLVPQPGVATEIPLPGPARHRWDDLLLQSAELQIESLPFDHPLWVVYSSGTTGLPKPIVHGHGGIVVEHLKMLGLHCNLRAGDVFHWYSSSGWIMWNVQVGGLLAGATIALYDGSPGWPDFGRLWRFVDEAGVTAFGAGAAFFGNCIKAGIEPARIADLSRLAMLGSTGSPLPPEGYEWIGAMCAPTCGSTRSPAAPTSPAPSSAATRCCRFTRARCSAAASARRWRRSTRPASR
jgi:acetoacetyl-CoA synthetase